MKETTGISTLYNTIRSVILEAKTTVFRTVNFVSVVQNREIGRMIVEEEQGGKSRSRIWRKYLIKELAERLSKEYGSSYGQNNPRRYRQFYLSFPIHATVRHES